MGGAFAVGVIAVTYCTRTVSVVSLSLMFSAYTKRLIIYHFLPYPTLSHIQMKKSM